MQQKLYKHALSIVKKLQSKGFTAYFAGGWVRDYLLNHPSNDIDIATTASVEEIANLFDHTVPVGAQFGILIVVIEDHPFEVATFRKEDEYLDGRRPTSYEPCGPKEDAFRRDFTINGMFFDPVKETLFDYIEGEKDLKKGIVKAIGDPNLRFKEDRLRMIRAVRYSARFHFPIDPDTLSAIIFHANELFPSVAIERVYQEMSKMSDLPHFDHALLKLHETSLLPVIFPELKSVKEQEIKHRLSPLPKYPKNTPLILKLLTLFPHFCLEEKLTLGERFKISRKEKAHIEAFHAYCNTIHQGAAVTDYDWMLLYANPHWETYLATFGAHLDKKEFSTFIHMHKDRRASLENAIERHLNKAPLVSSDMLKKAGIKPGPNMGKLIQEGEKIAVNQKVNEPNKVLELLKASPSWPV